MLPQNTYHTDQVKSVGGITVGDVRYSIRTRGYKYGAAAVIQHIELCCDAEVLASEPNTEEGRNRLMIKTMREFSDHSLPGRLDNMEWILSHINEVR